MPSILWRSRRDGGLDRCTLAEAPNGYRLSGTVLLAAEGVPCEVRYTVMTDAAWRTRSVGVHLQGPAEDVRLAVAADGDGAWLLGREPVPDVAGALDVDLAVTPATNTLPIRRLALEPGQAADLVVAYVSFPDLVLARMEQRYERLGPDLYRYSNPGFSAHLRVDEEGLVTDYEHRWEAVAQG